MDLNSGDRYFSTKTGRCLTLTKKNDTWLVEDTNTQKSNMSEFSLHMLIAFGKYVKIENEKHFLSLLLKYNGTA